MEALKINVIKPEHVSKAVQSILKINYGICVAGIRCSVPPYSQKFGAIRPT